MRFLLNMNVPRELGRRLAVEGHECRHVGDIAMAKASDLSVMEEARGNNEIIVTHDLDYGDLLAFSGELAPSVVIFRLRNTHPDNLIGRIIHTWPEIEDPLTNGAVVVLEDAGLRIRRLPITREA
jgi:predicted nuclease of predicted toxin-antitoxin system